MVDYITLSIPVFFILIGIEIAYSVYRKLNYYRLNDSIANLSQGIGSQLVGLFLKTATFFAYLYIFDHWRFYTFPNTVWIWLLLFVGVDFFYYWFHRMSHEVNALWAAHIVHHQSEEYNLTVALRQSWFQGGFSWIFYLPLAFAGFDPIMFLTVSSFNTLYQFWIHTRAIGKMGPLEWIFNTPSHHRVHHGSNKKYIDKNHAGSLIIWDRMFGTFQAEEEEVVYGITKPLASWNPVWANFHYWYELFKITRKTSSVKDKLKVFVNPPGWLPEELVPAPETSAPEAKEILKYSPEYNRKLIWYLLVQFLLALVLATLILFFSAKLNSLQLISSTILVVLTLTTCGALFEHKGWLQKFEYFRLIFWLGTIFTYMPQPGNALLIFVNTTLCITSLVWFYLIQPQLAYVETPSKL
ncbi:sterol desaturase family protein [Flavihumibacter sp. R14]|nr:sterol desaturase family protein [Flavihumibacter soli]